MPETHRDPSPRFETRRLVIEPLRAEHAAELFTLLCDPRIYEFIPEDPPVTEQALKARFDRFARAPDRKLENFGIIGSSA